MITESKNLFGQVEEARDAGGIRFYEYDWRGLVTKVSHRFWPQEDSSSKAWDNATSDLWSQGASWDPEVDDTARGSVSTWLTLNDLTDTTTIEIETSYDAAGRVTQVDYPEGMSLRTSYNEAGLPEQLELDRGTGSGWEDVVTSVTYNARGQVTELEHGNGVVTTREYDADIERLTRIFTELPGSPDVEFQDLEYEYDPVGNPLSITDNLTSSSYAANDIIPNTRTFRYDARYRLTRATGKMHDTITDRSTGITVTSPDPNETMSYDFMVAYDEVGNFTRNDEYQSTGTTTLNYKSTRIDLYNGNSTEATNSDPTLGNFTYDANGNTLHTPRIDELAYTFDNQVRYVDLGGGGEVRYFRHGDQRVVRMVQKTGVTGLSIYLGPFEYHYRDATTGYTKLTLHCGLHGRHAQAEVVLDGSDPDSLDVFFVHGDHLGSGHVLTKDDGTLLSQEEYFPYGRASDRRDSRNRYRYIGVERDEDTGLCMTGPRTYDPVSGRFLQGDPIAMNQSGHTPYHYSSGNPLFRHDPNGYQDTPASETMAREEGWPGPDVKPGPPSELQSRFKFHSRLVTEYGYGLVIITDLDVGVNYTLSLGDDRRDYVPGLGTLVDVDTYGARLMFEPDDAEQSLFWLSLERDSQRGEQIGVESNQESSTPVSPIEGTNRDREILSIDEGPNLQEGMPELSEQPQGSRSRRTWEQYKREQGYDLTPPPPVLPKPPGVSPVLPKIEDESQPSDPGVDVSPSPWTRCLPLEQNKRGATC
ncbi:MAG: RHS repeat protein [Alphaproteobacteria bacterium]|nr:RHS repeat protein [Alphaproteobacteria bacterium]MCB9791208.1 RHS repeat protein [Alphaproteobacteria bacterium]